MKFITAIFSAALFIAIAASAYTQSLAEIANKEKQRREQIDKTPDVITNDTISKYSGGSVSTVTPIQLPSKDTDSESNETDAKSAKQGEAINPDEPVDFQGCDTLPPMAPESAATAPWGRSSLLRKRE